MVSLCASQVFKTKDQSGIENEKTGLISFVETIFCFRSLPEKL